MELNNPALTLEQALAWLKEQGYQYMPNFDCESDSIIDRDLTTMELMIKSTIPFSTEKVNTKLQYLVINVPDGESYIDSDQSVYYNRDLGYGVNKHETLDEAIDYGGVLCCGGLYTAAGLFLLSTGKNLTHRLKKQNVHMITHVPLGNEIYDGNGDGDGDSDNDGIDSDSNIQIFHKRNFSSSPIAKKFQL